jgi:hypothetical protein
VGGPLPDWDAGLLSASTKILHSVFQTHIEAVSQHKHNFNASAVACEKGKILNISIHVYRTPF